MNLDQPPWPAVLTAGPVKLRPIRRRDARAWGALRSRNQAWLEPWDTTSPLGASESAVSSFAGYAGLQLRLARQGRSLPWLIEFEGELAGQLTGNGIERGALQQVSFGYWVSQHLAGRGIAPTALALAFDHAIGVLGLHRAEVPIRPTNANSLRVVEKLGFRCEGVRPAYLHVAGGWADHLIFALHAEDVPGGLLAHWQAAGG
ncbi:MAG: GNAT family N-acetyltransferase [Micrococcales bacterium]|nr:GNAT family N-acetyltransferase [Micrococcales bacterium]